MKKLKELDKYGISQQNRLRKKFKMNKTKFRFTNLLDFEVYEIR
jgi:hypothetical protein